MSRTRKEYMHPVYGLCVLIHPDPEDGALLIMERRGGDEDGGVRPFYFGCESSDLYHVGERVTGHVEKWVGDADALPATLAPVPAAITSVGARRLAEEAADPLGRNTPAADRRFMWEPTDTRYAPQEFAWADIAESVQSLLTATVRGGVKRVIFGQWRRIH